MDGMLLHHSQTFGMSNFGDELHPAFKSDVVGDWTQVQYT
jgi:hypothetical protein